MGLFLVATPIGNLSDITLRALDVLRSCDYILCEDTRHSLSLLKHYAIQRPLKSYHKFNEAAREDEVLQDLKAGQNVALISDAGTPGISDPGQRLVARCVAEAISVTPIPGPCAAIAALTASGLATDRFQFLGFLPRRSQQLRRLFAEVLPYPGTTICYESAERLMAVLGTLAELAPERLLVVCRELTKKFEEMRHGVASALLAHWQERAPKGEVVILIAGAEPGGDNASWEHLTLAEHVALVEAQYQLSKAEAIKTVAGLRGIPKRAVYRTVHHG